MANRKSLTDEDGEVRELTTTDFEHLVPFSALPLEWQQLLSSSKHVVPDMSPKSDRKPAA